MLDHSASARARTGHRLLQAGRAAEALELLAASSQSRNESVRITIARAHLALEQYEAALETLAGMERWADSAQQVLRVRATVQASGGDPEGMRATLSQLRGLAAGSSQRIAAAHTLEGVLERNLGNHGRAMSSFQASHRLNPNGPALRHIAALSESLGDTVRAYRAYAELCRRHGPQSAPCSHRDRLSSPPERIAPSTQP